MSIKRKLSIIVLSATSLVVLLVVLYQEGYRYNSTESYPIGIYKLNKANKTIVVGKLVLLCPPDTQIFEKANSHRYVADGYCPSGYQSLIKKIAAKEGDRVVVDKYVYINGVKQLNSKVYVTDSRGGRLVKPLKKEYILQKDEIFVLSDYNQRSFDSRYFGVVSSKLVQGKIKPIFIID